MKLPDFVWKFIGRKIASESGLTEGNMETKKWYQSKNVWTGVVTALMGLYLSLAPQFNWPNVPEWVFTLLGAIGVYTRINATKTIS